MQRAALTMAAVLAVCAAFTARMPEVYAKKEAPAKAKPKPKPRAKAEARCVRLDEARVSDDEMTFTLVNQCQSARTCTLSWSVTCDGGEPAAREVEADLPAGGQESWSVSAAHCGDAGFVIAPPRWACKAEAPASASAKD